MRVMLCYPVGNPPAPGIGYSSQANARCVSLDAHIAPSRSTGMNPSPAFGDGSLPPLSFAHDGVMQKVTGAPRARYAYRVTQPIPDFVGIVGIVEASMGCVQG